jgi:hypothetical protein
MCELHDNWRIKMIGGERVASLTVHFTNGQHIKYAKCKFKVDKTLLMISVSSGYVEFQLNNMAGYGVTYGGNKDT